MTCTRPSPTAPLWPDSTTRHSQPSPAQPSQAKPSQAKPSQAKPSQDKTIPGKYTRLSLCS
ncbi:hypothetical protein E2C01_091789 [Portunus trituberculatus]|uniref:Uncharacterized protein n=1 Tax=Portunus trituberculatus TaxID=210409 RepID=A0A5B7JQB5_PORTR|nr:hypothetical protein [Portunus trituberculatus]